MNQKSSYDRLYELAEKHGDLLRPPAVNHILVRLWQEEQLFALADSLRRENFYLVTMVANDERELGDHCFKIYYLFSHPVEDLFLTIEYLLESQRESYPSIYSYFQAVDPFEQEIRDMFGLEPSGNRDDQVQPGSRLHAPYPCDLYPLRRDRTMAQLKQRVQEYNRQGLHRTTPVERMQPSQGGLLLSVGPVHAGIIEPGRFVFHIAGEVIDDLDIFLGYTHKGIERLFQSKMTLHDGWRLAEQVSGDSAFAHSLAYCRAVEALAESKLTEEAELLRGLFLELERIYNHVGDTAALAHDVALDLIASELMVIREELVRLNASITGHRYLCGLNRPGGIVLPQPLDTDRIWTILFSCLERYTALADRLVSMSSFRNRAISTGILTRADALKIGATGLAARASGVDRDFRRNHPNGIYCELWLRKSFDSSDDLTSTDETIREDRAGDVYARLLARIQEVKSSATIVAKILERWNTFPERNQARFLSEVRFNSDNNYTFAIGHAEGWRGEVIYWIMQDKMEHIYRCKVRDPSMLNWPALRLSIIPHEVKGKRVETILADFPLINKSFNLSYSGNDL
jgi:Ni,Fe-hydrogenase III large subunit/Ni,Fe-hydrogenase III component G